MPQTVAAYAAYGQAEALKPFDVERRDLREEDVEIDILYCGVCHSDIHTVNNDWGGSSYPVVPGHEIVGKVARVGSAVTRFQVGQHVAVGCMVDSCRKCNFCERDLEQHCTSGFTGTYGGKDRVDGTTTYGGYSQKVVVADKFVLSMPEGLDLAAATPLLCAGITTYSPLRRFKCGPGKKVAVVGLGGLGHMALKLAHAMGAEVTLFTRSPGKEADARRLGASNVIISSDPEAMKAAANTFDLIVDTVPYDHDLNPYIATLNCVGTISVVGYLGPLGTTLNTAPLVFQSKGVVGSLIGGIAETQEMLDFCGEKKVVSDIEMIKMEEINVAYERMMKSDVKYRFVIDISSLNKN
ncbi:uncharacterized protein MONBRDRAFT_37421 [Monosiga brevicollis MX1]|uniref:Enoyl reductase (ER) domain-containing protein n=1 Tax=Monosiga brevicollis TaxID=81824 RepID=A9V1M5_MONBE|nr:uncharacterized protein MONBRDRAFT_37421 [Monosiga brevicollis MX1]EDQ88592.1 predicted protein [Monosiga brevicollis MX1]|eukprot:XP_001746696.1 hypothetical protein [Monosiga brevicollis MX1]